MLRRPEEVVQTAHRELQVYTSTSKLQAFIKGHLDPNYTTTASRQLALPLPRKCA